MKPVCSRLMLNSELIKGNGGAQKAEHSRGLKQMTAELMPSVCTLHIQHEFHVLTSSDVIASVVFVHHYKVASVQ